MSFELNHSFSNTAFADYLGVSEPLVAYEQGVVDGKQGHSARHPDDLVYMDGYRSSQSS